MQLRQARLDAGLTQIELAEAIGCSQSDISRLESGQRDITLERLKAIAAVLGVPVAQLLADEVA
ncbi:helix-turn-helix domain-containing protein [Halomonas sp. HL-93]|uniref:helix-turn-helix domain-containing protein n=1 Tax=Halomonas sp. HL-93 TaxID=1666906 RepID=UPI0006D978A1|nr:helix-turn-helix transcriptional regulator [Halomonas sp. HL-93]KPQ19687.1 MAG: putative transcriptional regulator [Halomonas sp. HL-93]